VNPWPNNLVTVTPYEETGQYVVVLGGKGIAVGDEDAALEKAEYLRGILRGVAAEASGRWGEWGAPDERAS